MAQEIITLENLAAEIAKLRGELATWKALAIKQDRLNTAQMLAVNSGATAGKIAQIATNTSDIAALQQIASSAFRVVKVAQLPASGEPYIMYLVPQTDGETLNYCNEYLWIDNAWELVGTTGAMANNGELQIIVNGVTVGTFTANQATDSTASITVPTDTSQLTNGAGYVDATALATALASKQDSLSLTQLAAVNSGITSADVAQIGANTTAIAGKQDALTTSQLAAVNSGITSADVTQIGTNTGNIATNSAAIISLQGSKQNALSAAQLLAVNSGITSSLVTQIGTNQSDITTLNTALGQSLAPSADNTYSLGGASFRYANVYAVTFTGDLTGTAAKAIADEDGTSIKTGYVNVAGNQTVSGQKTWSGDNTYSKPVVIERNTDTGNFLALRNSVAELGSTPASATPVTIAYRDKNNDNLGYMGVYYGTDGSNVFHLYVRNKFTSGSPSTSGTADYTYFGLKLNADKSKEGILKASFRPYDNNSYSLGSSSYQWNSVYAQTYYYNGTAWGLDKDNVWTGTHYFSKNLILTRNVDAGTVPSSSVSAGFKLYNASGTYQFAGVTGEVNTNGTTFVYLTATNKFSNGALDPNGTNVPRGMQIGIRNDGTGFIYTDCGWRNSLVPNSADSGFLNLGTSTNKWKTLNGINPGALSLPDASNSVNIDTTGWVTNGSVWNTITSSKLIDGYLYINYSQCSADDYVSVRLRTSNYQNPTFCFSANTTSVGNHFLYVCVPVSKLFDVFLEIKTTGTLQKACVFPCLGNV